MRIVIPAIVILCMLLSACNHQPSSTTTNDGAVTDSSYVETPTGNGDSIMMKEPITSYTKHYFSDSTQMDSFVLEMPAGNIVKNSILVKIYNSHNHLLFLDSISSTDYFEVQEDNQGTAQTEVAINDLRRAIMGAFGDDNFAKAGDTEFIKNAKDAQIKNREVLDETLGNPDKTVFNFYDSYRGTSYVVYSESQKGAVIIAQTGPEDRD